MLLASSSVLVMNHMLGYLQSIMLPSPFIFVFHLLIPYPAFSIALIELPNTTAIVNHPAVPRNARSDTPPFSIYIKNIHRTFKQHLHDTHSPGCELHFTQSRTPNILPRSQHANATQFFRGRADGLQSSPPRL